MHFVVNTNCHGDHTGDNALLAPTTASPSRVLERETRLIADWDTIALWLNCADQRGEHFTVSEELLAGRQHSWGGLAWLAIAVPGHDMGIGTAKRPDR